MPSQLPHACGCAGCELAQRLQPDDRRPGIHRQREQGTGQRPIESPMPLLQRRVEPGAPRGDSSGPACPRSGAGKAVAIAQPACQDEPDAENSKPPPVPRSATQSNSVNPIQHGEVRPAARLPPAAVRRRAQPAASRAVSARCGRAAADGASARQACRHDGQRQAAEQPGEGRSGIECKFHGGAILH